MRIAGKWVGFGLGDVDPAVGAIRDLMKRKFQWVRDLNLPDTTTLVDGRPIPTFDEPMLRAVVQMQTNYGLPATGIVNAETQYAMGYKKRPPAPKPRGTLYTCQGTVPSAMDWGPQADVARMVEDLYYWQPCWGEYQAVPMNRYITPEKAELRRQISLRPLGDPINAIGYSQGAIVVAEVYEEMKRDGDPRFRDWRRAVTFGNPCRELGVNNGNKFARFGSGYPDLGRKSRGIMEDSRRMAETPAWWMDFAHPKDMYCDTPDSDAGEFQTAICMMIMGNFTGGDDNIFSQILEWSTRPLIETFAVARAVMNAGLFFGGGIKPHLTYDVGPAIGYLRA